MINSRSLEFDPLEDRLTLSAASFAPHGIGTLEEGNRSVFLADLDGDGDLDALSASSEIEGPNGNVSWHENLGSGIFGPRRVLNAGLQGAIAVTAADIDGDGDLDVASAAAYRYDEQLHGGLEWYENMDGKGSFGDENPIVDGPFNSIRAADFNGDARVDLVSVKTSQVRWYDVSSGKIEEHVAVSPASFAIDAIPFDGNGDGHLDLLVVHWRVVSWYANTDGLGNFELVDEIDFPGATVHGAEPADMDGDGDLDVVISTDQEVEWYRLEGGQFSFAGRVTGRLLVSGQKTKTADLDGDGDLDFVAASRSQVGIAWYENMDGKGSFDISDAHPIASPDILESLAVGDVDGDGRVDVLGATWRSNLLVWYENRVPGDANDDGIFNSSDLVQVFQAGKYESAVSATYDEGDWNGDGQFESADLVLAFKAGPHVAEAKPAEGDTAAAADWLFEQDDRERRWLAGNATDGPPRIEGE